MPNEMPVSTPTETIFNSHHSFSQNNPQMGVALFLWLEILKCLLTWHLYKMLYLNTYGHDKYLTPTNCVKF
jgi:hypothetical protein